MCFAWCHAATTGRSNAQDVLADSLLAPLVMGPGLLPVQVQLLVKLAKDADSLQPRWVSPDFLQSPVETPVHSMSNLWKLPNRVEVQPSLCLGS